MMQFHAPARRHRSSKTRGSRSWAITASVLMVAGLVTVAAASSASAATVPSNVVVNLSAPVQQYQSPISATAVATVGGKPAPGRIRIFWDGHLAFEAFSDARGAATWQLQGSIPVGRHNMVTYFLPSKEGIATSATQRWVGIVRATPTIEVVVPKTKPPFGSWTTITIGVTGKNIGPAIGTVRLSENGRYIATALLKKGVAQINFPLISVPGNNVFSVSYNGSAPINAGSRGVLFPTSKGVPSLAITSLSASTSGGRVAVQVGGSLPARGPVTALVDDRAVSSGSLDTSGGASLALPALSPGNHVVKVRFGGELRYVSREIAKSFSVRAPVRTNPCSAAARACVDLTHNTAWIQLDGNIIYGPVPMLSGRPGYRTSPGTFSVYWKDINHKSSIFDDAPMPYAIFFDGGTAFHEGSLYVTSHGCIHLSNSAASYFWNALAYGDIVNVFGYAPY